MFDWAKELSCAVTVCDTNGVVLYQNDKSKATFSADGEMVGKSLKDCHKPESWASIQRLMNEEKGNCYTIEKKGVKKLIHQTPWYGNGKVAGLVEISIEIPFEMPHHVRD
jgi:transcriptional regulator with PAS, ATPase and Fis domain